MDPKEFTENPVVEEYDHRYVRFWQRFAIYSTTIGGWLLFPIGFVCDRESIPLFRGTSIRGGYAHDLLCRKDAHKFIMMETDNPVPEITKRLAADVYLEIMNRRYRRLVRQVENSNIKYKWLCVQAKRAELYARRYGKYWVVRIAWGYFRKHNVLASLDEVMGR